MDRGAQQATVYRVTKSQTRLKRLSTDARTAVTYIHYSCKTDSWGEAAESTGDPA